MPTYKDEILSLKEKIEEIFLVLQELDKKRLQSIEHSLKEKDLDSLLEFESYTRESTSLFKEFENSFLKITAYTLLIKKGGHKDPLFQELFRRYKLLESFLKKLRHEREKQVKAALSLIASGSGKTFTLDWLNKRRLASSLLKENDIKLLIVGIYQKDQENIELIRKHLDAENKKFGAVAVLSSALWMVPFLGTVLFIGILSAYSWANKYSENYKRLIKLAKK